MSMTFAEANYFLSIIKRDVASAIVESNERFNGNPHMAWHFLPYHWQQEYIPTIILNIEQTLIPFYTGHGPWDSMIPDLVKLCKLLRYMEAGPIYGCGECH